MVVVVIFLKNKNLFLNTKTIINHKQNYILKIIHEYFNFNIDVKMYILRLLRIQ
jgi:hypothetical protein